MPATNMFLGVSILVLGCHSTVAVTPLNGSPRPIQPRSPAEVELFMTAAPPYPYVDVAYLEAEQSSEMSVDGTAAFIAKLRAQAASIGCDGLVLGGPTHRETVSWSDVAHDVVDVLSKQPVEKPASYGRPATLHGMTATCIVYRDPAHAVAVAPVVDAPGAAASYEACRQQRIEIMRRAARITDLPERGRTFRSMPSCGEPPPGWRAPAVAQH
jgi:hypothetical protein